MSEKEETYINSSSWIMVDEIEKEDGENCHTTEKPNVAPRETVEDIIELDESDGISIISEPEEGTLDTGKDSIEEYTDSQSKDQLVSCDKSDIVVITKTEPKPIISTNGLTSAGFMILGLLIALYFQKGSYDVISSEKEYNSIKSNEQEYEPNDFKDSQDVEYIEDDTKRIYEKNNFRYDNRHIPSTDARKMYDNKEKFYKEKQLHKDSRKKKYIYDIDKYENGKQRNFKKYKRSSEERNNYLYKNVKKLQEQEDYLMKKQQKLKKKEEKLKQKEMKINARQYSDESTEEYVILKKNKKQKPKKKFSGDWYDNLHNGRNAVRKHQRSGDWYFERAEYRNKKRDKANWYFNWMDDREHIRVKHSD